MGCETALHRAKPKHRKGLWSPEEDQRLRNYILKHGHGCWSSVPLKAGLQRNGKSCRLRWINYLRPGLKRGAFSQQEEDTILALHHMLGNKWSQIAQHLPGRTDNEVKNFWHSYLKKKLEKTEQKSPQKNPTFSTASTSDSADSSTQSMDSPKHPKPNSLPKLFFAEWLAPDHHIGGGDRGGSVFGPSLGFHEDVGINDGVHFSVGSFGLEVQNGAIYDGRSTEMIDHHVKFEDQISNGLVNYASAGDACVEQLLQFGNGLMYI